MRANVVDPEFWVGYYQLAQAYQELGESDLALDALQKAGLFSGGNSKVLSLRGYIFAKLGRRGEARELLKTLEAVARNGTCRPTLWRSCMPDSESATQHWTGSSAPMTLTTFISRC